MTNRLYRIFRATDLTNGGWQEIYSAPGTNGVMSYLDPLTDAQVPTRPNAFYRVGVEQ